MKTCSKCNAVNADSASYCSNCGSPLSVYQPNYYQQSCTQPGGNMGFRPSYANGEDLGGRSVGLSEAVKICLQKKYATFKGRAKRSEYWYFYLFELLVMVALLFIGAMLGAIFTGGDGDVALGVGLVFMAFAGLAFITPQISVAVRRLHDSGKSGWLYVLCVIPYSGGIVMLIFMCLPSEPHDNKYGPYRD